MYEYRLRIKSIKTKEQLEKLRNILNYFDLEDTVARYEETKTHFDFGLKNVIEPSLKLPMEFFLEGIKSYFYGFNEATIFYSSLSVELMLLLKASKRLGEAELSRTHSIFWWLINETDILDQEHVAIAENLRLLRNCYVHIQNKILYSRINLEKHLKSLETYENERIPKQVKDEVIKNIRILQKSTEEIFPTLRSILTQRNFEFMKKRYNLYWEWLLKEKKWDPTKALEAGPREYLRTRQGRFDALDALNWSKSLLEFCIRYK